jgi:hypothetical protein
MIVAATSVAGIESLLIEISLSISTRNAGTGSVAEQIRAAAIGMLS